jgi:hypothetical protein
MDGWKEGWFGDRKKKNGKGAVLHLTVRWDVGLHLYLYVQYWYKYCAHCCEKKEDLVLGNSMHRLSNAGGNRLSLHQFSRQKFGVYLLLIPVL